MRLWPKTWPSPRLSSAPKWAWCARPIYDEPIKQEYAQGIRLNLITQLTKRQRSLQEARALLDDSAPGFVDLRLNRDYKGDSYPGGIPKLSAMLGAYISPEDLVAAAIKSLKTKYDITDADLAK